MYGAFVVKICKSAPWCFALFIYPSVHNLLTPWSRVLLEKRTGSVASQEIPHIFGIRRFITLLTSARHCPYPEPTPSNPHNPLPLPEDPS
jgi:hypothetical protein